MARGITTKDIHQRYYITRSGRVVAKKLTSRFTLAGKILRYLSVGTRGVTGGNTHDFYTLTSYTEELGDVRKALAGLIKKGYVSLKPPKA